MLRHQVAHGSRRRSATQRCYCADLFRETSTPTPYLPELSPLSSCPFSAGGRHSSGGSTLQARLSHLIRLHPLMVSDSVHVPQNFSLGNKDFLCVLPSLQAAQRKKPTVTRETKFPHITCRHRMCSRLCCSEKKNGDQTKETKCPQITVGIEGCYFCCHWPAYWQVQA